MKFIAHPDLQKAQSLAYNLLNITYQNYIQEVESLEYGACSFELNNTAIKFRVAHITPTKIGQFVTFWKRIDNGPTMPYDEFDDFDLLIVSVRNGEQFGQFIFSKDILLKQNILSKNTLGGKRGFRVYPPWDIATNQQAKKTQAWQLSYFAQIQPNCHIIILDKLLNASKTA